MYRVTIPRSRSLSKDTEELKGLATEANHQHGLANEAFRSALKHARNAGVALRAAKEHCKHGEWKEWVAQHFQASYETAVIYMRIAREWDNRVKNWWKENSNISIRDVTKLLRDSEGVRSSYRRRQRKRNPAAEDTDQQYVEEIRKVLASELARQIILSMSSRELLDFHEGMEDVELRFTKTTEDGLRLTVGIFEIPPPGKRMKRKVVK